MLQQSKMRLIKVFMQISLSMDFLSFLQTDNDYEQ